MARWLHDALRQGRLQGGKAVLKNRTEYFSDIRSLWLFPFTYFLHIFEEWWADFPAHLLRTQGVVLSQERFVGLQSFGLVLMVVGIVLSRKLRFPYQMRAILATLVIGNSISHVLGSVSFGGYEPGLLTSVFLWLPLGTLSLLHSWQRMNVRRLFLCAAIGLAISFAVKLFTISKSG